MAADYSPPLGERLPDGYIVDKKNRTALARRLALIFVNPQYQAPSRCNKEGYLKFFR